MLILKIMRVFFHLLYHQFAFAYDLVADIVSLGQWKNWGKSVIPFINGAPILELGHGPGHLQKHLLHLGLPLTGLDESSQMGRIARQRLGNSSHLVRGLAQSLPFADRSFKNMISTFPSDYIFESRALSEVGRCLSEGGRLIVLPMAWPKSRVLRGLFRVTGESPSGVTEPLIARVKQPFIHAGFRTEVHLVEVKSGSLMILVAERK